MQNQITNGFIQRLVAEGVLTKEKFARVMAEAKHQQISFITYLINAEITDSSCLLQQLLAKEFCLAYIDLNTIDPSCLPIHLIEEKLLQKYQVIHYVAG